ncbi:MAG TPA: YceI family protein [Pseudonocardiaceae bacterium]|jgi:polyisoprenoid-binding protein YceI|nr:YceI family protein [Pseudonocardiaceae bacterium]
MSIPAVALPGYVAGTWNVDLSHSDVSITARHFMVSKVRGNFTDFAATIVTAENPLDSSVTATIKAASIDTRQDQRNAHIRSADFLDADNYPEITFQSTGMRQHGDAFKLDGNLTIRGNTHPVTLDLELSGIGPDPYGGTRIGLSARTSVSRSEFGINFNALMETGGAVVGDKLEVILEIEAALEKPAA